MSVHGFVTLLRYVYQCLTRNRRLGQSNGDGSQFNTDGTPPDSHNGNNRGTSPVHRYTYPHCSAPARHEGLTLVACILNLQPRSTAGRVKPPSICMLTWGWIWYPKHLPCQLMQESKAVCCCPSCVLLVSVLVLLYEVQCDGTHLQG